MIQIILKTIIIYNVHNKQQKEFMKKEGLSVHYGAGWFISLITPLGQWVGNVVANIFSVFSKKPHTVVYPIPKGDSPSGANSSELKTRSSIPEVRGDDIIEKLEREIDDLKQVVKFHVLYDSQTFIPNLNQTIMREPNYLNDPKYKMQKKKFEYFNICWQQYSEEIEPLKKHPEILEQTNLLIDNISKSLE